MVLELLAGSAHQPDQLVAASRQIGGSPLQQNDAIVHAGNSVLVEQVGEQLADHMEFISVSIGNLPVSLKVSDVQFPAIQQISSLMPCLS